MMCITVKKWIRSNSLTDWIRALSVLFLCGVAIYEFYINDRIADQQKKYFVSEMILKGTSSAVVESMLSLFTIGEIADDKKITYEEAVAFEPKIFPLEFYYDAWGFCYENDLCDKELALNYICNQLTAYVSVENMYNSYLVEKPENTHDLADYALLLDDCIKLDKQREIGN